MVNMDIFSVLSLMGGLAMFLYGMNVMSSGLEKLAGGKLEKIFERLTSNPIKSVCLGAAVTAVIQSSSASTVMVVGFVNAGIMKLHSAIGIVMGANIGTTVTAWLLSLSGISGDNILLKMIKPASFAPIIAVIGVAVITFSKKGRKIDIASIMIGFAVLMFGMTTMSDAVAPLKDVPEFAEILFWFKNPILGVFAGAALTAIIQSSSASVGILQALSAAGVITFGSAFPIILGQNIGTCVTAMLSSVGASKNAKRIAVVHLYFNIIGTLLFLTAYYTANSVIHFSFADSTVGSGQIAIVHTIFNVSTTLILLPFTKLLEKLAFLTIKDTNDEKHADLEQQFRILDERFLQSPTFAVEKCRELTVKMGEIACDSIRKSVHILKDQYDADIAKQIKEMETATDIYEDRLGSYLIKISAQSLSESDSRSVTALLHIIGDFERIADHALNISETALERFEKKSEFSVQGDAELDVMCSAVTEIIDMALNALRVNDLNVAQRIEPLEETVDNLRSSIRNRHVKRLQQGKCTMENGVILNDLLTDLERVSDHCSNIAVCLIEEAAQDFDIHEYMKRLKKSGESFERQVSEYMLKYGLPKV